MRFFYPQLKVTAMHHYKLFIQCPYQLTHHQSTNKIQPSMPRQFETALLFNMAPYSLQQFQPGSKQLKIIFFNLGLN